MWFVKDFGPSQLSSPMTCVPPPNCPNSPDFTCMSLKTTQLFMIDRSSDVFLKTGFLSPSGHQVYSWHVWLQHGVVTIAFVGPSFTKRLKHFWEALKHLGLLWHLMEGLAPWRWWQYKGWMLNWCRLYSRILGDSNSLEEKHLFLSPVPSLYLNHLLGASYISALW